MFPKIISKMKFKFQQSQFESLTKDEDFLRTYLQLYKLDGSHQIFNNALQWFINQITIPEILQFIMEEMQKPYQFNQDWTDEAVPQLIKHIMNNYHPSDIIEIIKFILKYSNFDLELILKNITTTLQLWEKKSLPKINSLHPLLFLITEILGVFEPALEEVQQTFDLILSAFRHFFRDLLREYAVQSKTSAVSEFIIAFSTQIPQKIDSIFCSSQLITLYVNEIANTISYLQYEKKLISQAKLKLLDLVINLQNNSNLYKINYYFNFYDIQQKKTGKCQLCLYEDQPIISFYETEKNSLLVEPCKECFCSGLQLSNHFEDQVYLPTIIYGHSFQKKDNWMKLYYQNYYINQKLNNGKSNNNKRSKSINVQKFEEMKQFLDQLIIDYGRLDETHMYLSYFAYMSLIFQQLFQTYKNIELILLAFFEDNSIQVRARVLHQLTEYCQQIQQLQTPQNFKFSIFQTQIIVERIKLRSQDVSKQIRGMIMESLLQLLEKSAIQLDAECLDIIINRLSDIEIQVRCKTAKSCLEHIDLFKKLPQHQLICFFEEVSKRLEEDGEIADVASQLIMLLLVSDTKQRDSEIADRLLELTLDSNNLKIDYDRIQNLIDKLSDNNKIIDKTGLLHFSLLRLIQFANENKDKQNLNQVENALRLIQIITSQNNIAQQKIAIKQIDNIMQITSYYLNKQDETDSTYVNVLNGLFKLLIFCFEELNNHKIYDKLSFPLTSKLINQLDYLIIFIEKIIYKIHPRTAYMRSIFTLSVLLDLKYTKNYKNIYSKFETVIKLILVKAEEESVSFQFGLIGFCQIFEYFEHFITRVDVDVKSFLVEDIQTLYDSLLDFSKEKSANEEIIFTMSKMWEKIPQLMFESCEFLKENMKENQFQEAVIIAIYQTFYKSITDANQQAQQQQFDSKVDKSQISFMIKDIFNVVFQQHILHKDKKIRVLVLKLIELLFDNQLSIALQFGDYLIVSLMNDPEISEQIIKKCIEVRPEHMMMQFQKGIKLLISNYQMLKPFFTNLDIMLKNLNRQTLVCKSEFQDLCTQKLSEYLLYLDESFFLNKIDSRSYFTSVEFILYQLIHLQYLSKHEIKIIIKSILNRIEDLLSRVERKMQQLNIEKDSSIVKVVLIKVFYAYQIAIQPDVMFGENIKTLRQVYQMKQMKRKSQQRKSKILKEVQCFEITHKHINKFNQYINANNTSISIKGIDMDLSDSEQEKAKSSNKLNQNKQEIELIEQILDCELGNVDQMFQLFDEYGVFDKVLETGAAIKDQAEVIEEVEQEKPKKSRRKTTKRKPRRYN